MDEDRVATALDALSPAEVLVSQVLSLETYLYLIEHRANHGTCIISVFYLLSELSLRGDLLETFMSYCQTKVSTSLNCLVHIPLLITPEPHGMFKIPLTNELENRARLLRSQTRPISRRC